MKQYEQICRHLFNPLWEQIGGSVHYTLSYKLMDELSDKLPRHPRDELWDYIWDCDYYEET